MRSTRVRSVISAVALALSACALGVAMPASALAAADVSGQSIWIPLQEHAPNVKAAQPWIRPERGQALLLNTPAMHDLLKLAPREGTPAASKPMTLVLPDPDGREQAFSVLNSPVMEPGLAAQFPDIITLVGQGIDDPTATLRVDITPQGFHAQTLSAFGDWYIDPYSAGDSSHYTSYYKRHLKRTTTWTCQTHAPGTGLASTVDRGVLGPQFLSSGTQLRTYRTAVACTGEYAAFHGGTVALAQAAIVTAVNRVTGVYERDVAIRLVLVASNTNVVFTNSATDPYTNNNGGTMLGQNQTRLDTAPPNGIGTANYDIGHVFSTGGGGIASLGAVCVAARKAQGVTGSPSPTGDPFWIDYVAHEMGHQFGGNHNFNSNSGSCAGNRNASTAFEPGSGSTIMAYAGICSTDDIQSNSDAYFHTVSYNEIRTFVTSGSGASCGTVTATGNNIPTVTGPGNFTIPRSTPFFLTATGSDPDGDTVTYCWEERALGASITLAAADNGTSPLTRTRNPTTNPTRFIPQISTVLAGTNDIREKLPTLARGTWNWRCTIRDNRAGGGGVNEADVVLTVNGTAGPFTVTAPVGGTSWGVGTSQTVTWSVAGTNAAPVNTANVAIQLSLDGGSTWPVTLAASTPNNGSANITVPNNPTTNGRIRVLAVGNIFYNVNQGGPITITGVAPPVVLNGTGVNAITDTTGNGNSNTRIDPGESDIRLTVQINNTGSSTATNVSATLTTSTPTATILSGSSAYPNLIAAGGAGNNTSPYVLSISPSHVCGVPINLSLAITSDQGTGTYTFSLPTGLNTGTGFTCQPPAATCPSFTQQPASVTNACLGATITFTAAATGVPAPTYQWFKGPNALANDPNYSGVGTATLTITNALAFTADTYSVVATNSCGPTSSNSVTLSFCIPDFNCANGVSVQDIFDFLQAWFSGNPRADVNAAGGIGTQDIFDFLGAWFGGCP